MLGDRLVVESASPALRRMLGDTADALVGRPLLDAVHPEDRSALTAALQLGAARDRRSDLLLLRLPDDAGDWRYLEAAVSDLRAEPEVASVVLHCRDVTDRLALEQARQAIAYTDPMTGLPNRAGFLQQLDERLSMLGGADEGGPSTLLLVELDDLSAARGHIGREAVLSVVSELGDRLRGTVRVDDVVARMGGGAFAVLAAGGTDEVERLAARCLSAIEQPVRTPSGLLDLTAGIGLVSCTAGLSAAEILARGDLAVRAAHAVGAGSVERYATALSDGVARRDRLRTDLRGARHRRELALFCAPIAALGAGGVTGIEATLHWRHPALGEISSAELLDIAERAGLAGELVRWALGAGRWAR